MRAPLLAAVSLDASGGGVAVVARLLWDVLQRQWGGDAQLLTLIDGSSPQATFAEKSRYALRLAHAQGNADWVLYSHLGLAKPLLGMPRTYRKPYGIFLHGIEAWCTLPPAQLKLLAGAELLLANSSYTANRVMATHPEVGRVEACPLALPISRSESWNAPDAPLPRLGPHAVLVVGRMLSSERYKGHDELIDIWPTVVARVPDAQLVIAGTGDDLPRLQEKAAHSPAAASIVFTGFVSRATLNVLYGKAALFALPSRGEGFGLVYLEAMAHQRACIGSIHDAAGDVIVDGRTGRLVNQDDLDQLAGAIIGLLQDPVKRTRMGIEGRRRLDSHFSYDAFASRFLKLVANGTESFETGFDVSAPRTP
jgi:phosphatidylinositol alpha-1,6-mannosyltransferase